MNERVSVVRYGNTCGMGIKHQTSKKPLRSAVSSSHQPSSLTLLPQESTCIHQPEWEIIEQSPVTIKEMEAWEAIIDQKLTLSDKDGYEGLCHRVPVIKECSSEASRLISLKAKFSKSNHSHRTVFATKRCNKRSICPSCAWHYSQKKAYEGYEFIERNIASRLNFPVVVSQIVPTVPHEMDNMVTGGFAGALKRFIKNIESDALTAHEHKRLKKKFLGYLQKGLITSSGYDIAVKDLDLRMDQGRLLRAGLQAIQTHSSENPFERHLHAHILLLNVCWRDGGDSLTSGFTRSNHFFNVDKLRTQWKKALGLPANHPINVQVSYAYFHKDKARVLHWLRYIYRYDVWDIFKLMVRRGGETTALTLDTGSSQPQRQKVMFNTDISTRSLIADRLSRKKQNVVWFGWLTPSKRNDYIRRLGVPVSLDVIRYEMKERASCCDVCGSKFAFPVVEDWHEWRDGKITYDEIRFKAGEDHKS